MPPASFCSSFDRDRAAWAPMLAVNHQVRKCEVLILPTNPNMESDPSSYQCSRDSVKELLDDFCPY